MIYSIIPARGGSKGVPRKNVKLLCGYPLLAYSIAASKLTKNIGRTIVSTDSEEICDIAKRYGAEAPFIRPKELAGDNSQDIEFVLHAIHWFKEHEQKIPDYLVHLRPTTPLRDPTMIDRAIQELMGRTEATSLRSGHQAAESPFKWFLKNKEGYFTAIMSGYSNDRINVPRQAFPDVYIPDGYVDVLRTSFIMESNTLHGDKMIGFVSPACTEVDSPKDFEFLEFELNKTDSTVLRFLKANFSQER